MANKRLHMLIPEDLLSRIDLAAERAHLERSAWVRIMLAGAVKKSERDAATGGQQ